MSKSYKGRYSPGLTKADWLHDDTKRVMDRAKEQGNEAAFKLADIANSAAFNSRSAYEASQGMGGGSSKAFSLRREGAAWLKKGRKLLDEANAALAPAVAQQTEGEG